MRKIASVLMAGVIALGVPVATAAPAQAHISICARDLVPPKRLIASSNRVAASATTGIPAGSHQRRCGMDATIQVWAPNGRGGGKWRNLGSPDSDWTNNPRMRATAYPTSSLLFGSNLYRTHVTFWADGNQGTREWERASYPVRFNRYFVRR